MVFKKTSSLSSISEDKERKFLEKWTKKRVFQLGVLIFLIIAIAVSVFLFSKYQSSKTIGTGGNFSSNEIQSLLEEVGSKIELPVGETPTVATVSDVTKLQNQPFFRNAKNGDKVLFFAAAKQAILYRLSTHKIIAVAPFSATPDATAPQTNQTQETPSSASAAAPVKEAAKLKVVVLNSTKEAGLAKKGAELLDNKIADVIKASNSVGEYDTTTVSSVSKDKISDSQLKSLVSVFSKIKPTISSLPNGETAPAGADVVIILGSDFFESY